MTLRSTVQRSNQKFRSFAEIADELADKHGREWRLYACEILSDFWLNRITAFHDIRDWKPEPVTRDVMASVLGYGGPRCLRDTRRDERPWHELAAAKPRDWAYQTLRVTAERLGLPESDAQRWINEYSGTPDPYRTGTQGRSTAKKFVLKEAVRRINADEAELHLKDEAGYLRDWLLKNYPDAPNMTAKTIENAIRVDHRQYRGKKATQ